MNGDNMSDDRAEQDYGLWRSQAASQHAVAVLHEMWADDDWPDDQGWPQDRIEETDDPGSAR